MEPIKRGHIYMVQMNDANGSEQSGTRPFLVLQNDVGNRFSHTHSGVPLSTELKRLHLPTHLVIPKGHGLSYDSVILGEQPATLDESRFITHLGKLDAESLHKVDEVVNIQLELNKLRRPQATLFIKRLLGENPVIKVPLCYRCFKLLRGTKNLSIRAIRQKKDSLELCVVCNQVKGKTFKIIDRGRVKRCEVTKKSKK